MKVRELIKQLDKYDKDVEIFMLEEGSPTVISKVVLYKDLYFNSDDNSVVIY